MSMWPSRTSTEVESIRSERSAELYCWCRVPSSAEVDIGTAAEDSGGTFILVACVCRESCPSEDVYRMKLLVELQYIHTGSLSLKCALKIVWFETNLRWERGKQMNGKRWT